jgi:hypothetical protein
MNECVDTQTINSINFPMNRHDCHRKTVQQFFFVCHFVDYYPIHTYGHSLVISSKMQLYNQHQHTVLDTLEML